MSLVADEPKPVRAGEELNIEALAAYLDRELGAQGVVRLSLIHI